jgi:FixJ family two-component response regulator
MLKDQFACVYVIDNNWEVCKALADVIKWAGHNVFPARNSTAFLDVYDDRGPSCLFLDVGAGSEDGFAVQKQIAASAPSLAIVPITGPSDVAATRLAFEHGAFTTIEKPLVPSQILEVADRALGESSSRLKQVQTFKNADKVISRLSDREHEVFDLLTSGFRNRDIAEHLSITDKTVEAHRAAIKAKLGAGELSDLIALARDHALVA